MFNKEQLHVLEEHFINDQYPSYRAREDLAARLNLEEYKVQVRSHAPPPPPVPTAVPGPAPTLALTTRHIRGPAFRPSEVQGARARPWVTQEARALPGSGSQGLGEPREPLWQTPFLALELLSDQGRPLPPSSGLLCGLLKTPGASNWVWGTERAAREAGFRSN